LAAKLRKSSLPKTTLAGASGFVALQMLHSPAAKPEADPDKGGPCHLCTASCCRYFALEIDKPSNKRDYDHIRWYLMHEGVVVWVQDDDWYLEVRTTCRHLRHDNTCGIYETRPQICRDYGLPGADPCEYFTQDLEYDLFFSNDAEFEAWVDKKRRKRKKT
jgi:Fe-S-cluster containining protein